MSTLIGIAPFLEQAQALPVVDVRSPAEHRRGHIPGAVNIPLFDDAGRAAVGTTYVQVGRTAAVLQGLELVAPTMRALCEQALRLPSRQLLVHCWRGGMRSQAMAWLFETVGKQCLVLEGGYKAFRRAVLSELAAPRELRVLSGYTGSGKTEILAELKKLGQQVVDLEGLAQHRGSAFGALGQPPQPATEHFENLLFAELQRTDRRRPLWLEDESANIGRVLLTPAFFAQMKRAKTLQVLVPRPARVQRLLREYGGYDRALLAEAIKKLEKRLGYDRCKLALELCAHGRLEPLTALLLDYYDKAYGLQVAARAPHTVARLEAPEGASAAQIAQHIMSYEL